MNKRTRVALFVFLAAFAVILSPSARGQGILPGLEIHSPEAAAPEPVTPVISAWTPRLLEAKQPLEGEKLAGEECCYQRAWGILGMRGYVYGDRVAPNGVEFNPFFSLDLDFNVWVWRTQGAYLFFETRFWMQKPGQGITNPRQGVFDFSKRELDFTPGGAWDYYGNWEARLFAYSYNNVNRGDSTSRPSGFVDGVGLENRYYLTAEHERLGRADYDPARDTFVSAGYFPTKDMVDLDGQSFKPSFFARANVTYNLYEDWFYAFLDTRFLTERPVAVKFFSADCGLAVRPMASMPNFEVRVGNEEVFDFGTREWDSRMYLAVRLQF